MTNVKNKQREIKFRAWDKVNECFCNFDELWQGIRGIYAYGGVSSSPIVHDWRHEINCDHILMQYTGLKDKNGKEIYEGDIVRNDWTDCNGKMIGHNWVVKYGEHSAQGFDYYSNEVIGFYYEHKNETSNIINLPCNVDGDIEIIGNIYENGELLNGTTK